MKIEEKIVERLAAKEMTLAAAESCTGGMFISSLIGCDGASRIIRSSFITYNAESKMAIGVKGETLEQNGEVSEATALEMAQGAALQANANVGVGITGYAGRSSSRFELDGKVCFGFFVGGQTFAATKIFTGNRNSVRKQAARYALNSLYSMI